MLENLDLSKKLKMGEWQELRMPLQRRLYELQRAAFRSGMPVVILMEGWAAAGKGAAVRTLTQRLDPRGFRAWAIRRPSEADLAYPWLRRYWLKLPARGDIAIFEGSWYRQVLLDRAERRLREDEARASYRDCMDLEQMLAEDGCVIVKLWLHVSRDEQRRRLRTPQGESLRWPGSRASDWDQHRKYQHYLPLVEEMLALTHSEALPWALVEANDPHYAQWRALETVAAAIEGGLARFANAPAALAASESETPEVKLT
jgi:polyphosphate kinase 2 (PPK2 family)